SDLANDLGNLLSRTVAMTVKYFDGVIPAEREAGEFDAELKALAEQTPGIFEEWMNKLDFSRALEAVWKLVSRTNKYIDETAPWVLIKDPEKKGRLAEVMYNLTESLRIISVLVGPAMPDTGIKIADELKVPEALRTWDSIKCFGGYPEGVQVERCEPIFPRIEMKKAEKTPEP
ncbi:MAG: methionine--tRNA ligase, partial [Eubacterium sp.]